MESLKNARIRIEIKAEMEWITPPENKNEEIMRQQMQVQLDYWSYQCREEVKKFFNKKLEVCQKTAEILCQDCCGEYKAKTD